MYKIVCKDFVTHKRHIMMFEVKSSVLHYASLFYSFTNHGSYTISLYGEHILSRHW